MACELTLDLALEGSELVFSVSIDGVPVDDPIRVELSSLVNGTADVCAALQALTELDTETKLEHTIGISNGICVRVPATPVVYADAAGQLWDDTNLNWVPESSCPEFTELRVFNSPDSGGTAIYRNLTQSMGVGLGLQWHLVA